MARRRSVVTPELPRPTTHRRNRRQQTIFGYADYTDYCRLLSASSRRVGTRVLAYRLMPKHAHWILVPAHAFGLRDALGEAHRG